MRRHQGDGQSQGVESPAGHIKDLEFILSAAETTERAQTGKRHNLLDDAQME